MPGTKAGALKAVQTNKQKFGKDFYREIGRKGGKAGHTGGFYNNPELAKLAGAKGGRISRRGPVKKKTVAEEPEKPKETRPEIKRSLWQRLWGNQDVKK